MVKKRVSKKTKQSWRKHVDIKDVEEYLEDQRADERLGAPVDGLADQDLFEIDIKPKTELLNSLAEKRRILYETTPRCFKVLEPMTKVPDPITKRNRVRTREERRDRIAKSIEASNKRRGIVKAKDKTAEENRAYTKSKKEANKYKKGDVKQDLWEVEDFNPIDALNDDWFDSDTVRHNYQGLGKLRKHIPKVVGKKLSVVPNVEAPHPGTSYNPSFEDHQALLQEITKVELEIIKQEKHLERVTTKMFKRVQPEKKELSWMVEMSEGLNQIKDEKDSDSDGEFKAINPPVENKKKNLQQKRKQKEQRVLKDERFKAKLEKKKIADIYKLKFLEKEIEETKKKTELLKEKREKLKLLKLPEPKRLGNNKFEAPDLDFQMPDEISGNLRNIKTGGNLLKDRFKSLQKRNILEPTVKVIKKRGKVKKYEKPTHKMGWEPKGYKK